MTDYQTEPNLETDEAEEPSEEEDSKSKPKSKKRPRKPQLTNTQWWRAKESDRQPHEILDNLIDSMEKDQSGRYAAYKEYERLFGCSETAYGDDSFKGIASDDVVQNELQNTIETLWAQVFKNRILPAISTSDADWDEWDRARTLSRWTIGCFDQAKLYEEVIPQAGIYTLTHGTGPIRIDWEETEPGHARIFYTAANPRYVLVDKLEARRGRPRSYYFKDTVDRWVLYDTYGVDSKEFYGSAEVRRTRIEKTSSNDDKDLSPDVVHSCDMVTVREAWHLPSGYGANDGCHCIWIRGCTLLYEKFTWDRFPWVHMRFGARMEGFWGESAVRRLAPTQKLLDKLNKKIDESQDVMGVPRILVGRNGEGVKKLQVDDLPGGIFSVPDISQVRDWNAQCASPELYADRDGAPGKMRSLMGMSDFEVQQQIPAAMRDVSGAMLERWVDQGQARHAMLHAQYEDMIPELTRLTVMLAAELQEAGYKLIVQGPTDGGGKDDVEELDFADCKVDIKRAKINIQTMSSLPTSFAGKVDAIEKMKNSNIPLDPRTALRMLEIPDVQQVQDQMVSDEEIIFKNLCHMTKTGDYLPPMPWDNLDLIVQMTTRYINRYRVRKNANYDVIAVLAQYIDDAVALQKGLGGPNPNAPPTMSALGLGAPMAPGAVPPGMPPSMPGGPMPPMPGPPGAGMPGMPPMAPEVPQGPPMAGAPPL